MSYNYLITLKPLEPFFFGGEYTFGADDSRAESSRYSAISTQFPQQTAILGMIRKTMLIQNGNLTMHRKGEWVNSNGDKNFSQNYEDAKEITGVDAFSYEDRADLGTIKSLSPLFIKDDDEYFIANAKDYEFEKKEIEGHISLGKGVQKAFIFDGYDAKESNHYEYISNQKKLKNFSDFFDEVETVGIKKSKNGETQEDAFFRKKSYIPKDKALFAFIATFSKALEWDSALISLGADQSSFMLNITKTEDDFNVLFDKTHKAKKYSRTILASETLLSDEAYKSCEFVLGERKVYRQLIDSRKGKKSKRYYLLERGSVLYTQDIEKLETLLNQEHLQNIGINHYFTIKGTK